jgi:hypothetical protein
MFIPPHLLAKAEILSATFPRDASLGPSDDALANSVTWLIETFTIKRSLDLSLAIGRRIGGNHCVRAVDDGGNTNFALIAEEPHQVGGEAKGRGVTIFGRVVITDLVQGLSGEEAPQLQVGIAESERQAGAQDEALVRLAGLLPWYRGVLKTPAGPIDTLTLIRTCLQLGMSDALTGKTER